MTQELNKAKPLSISDELIFGIHAVEAALQADEVDYVWTTAEREDERMQALQAIARRKGIPIEAKSRDQMNRLLPGARHQGVMAQLKPVPVWDLPRLLRHLSNLQQAPFLLILDGLQDPHNVGACLRSAEAAGVHGVILPRDRACPINATVRKVSSGAASRVPIARVTNLVRSMEELKEASIWITGLAGEATSTLYQLDLRGPTALVMGAEGEGLRRITRAHCDALARIPMEGGCGSLNVSVAAGIALFEARRQRQESAA